MKSHLYYYILSGIFCSVALFTLILSSAAAIMQNSVHKHPIKLLHAHHPINRFLLSFPKQKQKNYFVIGLISGVVSGVCLGIATQRSKNQK